MVNSLQHQPPVQLAPEQTITVNQVSPTPDTDPVVRKQAVQDLMAQMQGTYNFMQVRWPKMLYIVVSYGSQCVVYVSNKQWQVG